MATPILIMGESGAGKSASLRNFTKDEISIFNVTNKKLPFKNDLPVINNAGYDTIAKMLAKASKKCYCIDDAGLNMAKENFARALETGYTKHTEMAKHFNDMLEFITSKLPDDIIVFIMMHTESTEDGKVKARTLGKMLDSNLGGGIEALFTIVLRAVKTEEGYKFVTGGEMASTAKAPMGMFPDKMIDNDAKLVDSIVRDYYGMALLTDKNTKTVDKNAKEKSE